MDRWSLSTRKKRRQTFEDVELLRERACDFECMRCCCCICPNCCSQDEKFIPLWESSFMPPSSEKSSSTEGFPDDVRLICSLLKEYEGTVFKRVLKILNAALCCKYMKISAEWIYIYIYIHTHTQSSTKSKDQIIWISRSLKIDGTTCVLPPIKLG